ncbi:MAG: hypothetical protein ABSA45_00390 [Verrucomicrobiota bacterium]|jgi:hypothetical protein
MSEKPLIDPARENTLPPDCAHAVRAVNQFPSPLTLAEPAADGKLETFLTETKTKI